MNRTTVIILVLALLSVALLLMGERRKQKNELRQAEEEARVLDRSAAATMVDTVLRSAGLTGFRRKPVSPKAAPYLRTEVRIQVPRGFVTIHLVTTLKDSLRRFGADLVATENFKERSSAIHMLYRHAVFETIHLTKQPEQKGATSSQSTKAKGAARKASR
ncbi:MAG: hypothetical protein NTV54_16795 [Ignavibacteriales bacterium]|nr:hypothetical protein [Ignavibacteriales bacterium]